MLIILNSERIKLYLFGVVKNWIRYFIKKKMIIVVFIINYVCVVEYCCKLVMNVFFVI